MRPPLPPISEIDRDHIVEHTADLWHDLGAARFFITGGTGFYGKWLLESIAAANDRLDTKARATVLSRDPGRFAAEMPHLAARPEFRWLVGDAASFAFPTGQFDYVLHFATASAAEVSAGGAAAIMHTLAGTRRVLEFSRNCRASRLLFASSGAVYGRQPAELRHIPEDYFGAPDIADPSSAYGETKRISELMCVTSGLDCVIARGFAFVGPYLPLTEKFAVGSFIRDALAGGPIRIAGDGSHQRSYLYAADLAIWLLAILSRGKSGAAYNMGSNEAITVADLAERISRIADVESVFGNRGNQVGSGRLCYVPSIAKARNELNLMAYTSIETALERTLDWAGRIKA